MMQEVPKPIVACMAPKYSKKAPRKSEIPMCLKHLEWLEFMMFVLPKIQLHKAQPQPAGPKLVVPGMRMPNGQGGPL